MEGPEFTNLLIVVAIGFAAPFALGLIPRLQLPAVVLEITSLPFIVAATTIGVDLGLVDQAESAALIASGLLSVIIFPVAGVTMLRRVDPGSARTGPDDVAAAAAP